MTTYIFLPPPGFGHVNPTLAIAHELVQRGHEVIYYLPEPFQEAVQATGALFRPYDSKLMKNLHPTVMVEECRHVLGQVLDHIAAERPDVIVYEPYLWARIVIEVLKVPAVALHSSYAINEHFNLFSLFNQHVPGMQEIWAQIKAGLAEICTTYHVAPFDLQSAALQVEPLNIVFLPRAFQPRADTFDERYLFVGPSILPHIRPIDFPLDRLDESRPLLYISLGTVWNDRLAFFQQCFEAFGASDYQVVLSHGRRIDPAMLGPIPNNFLVCAQAPQLSLLSRARVFVTHGGMNSVMESLFSGVPLVVLPQMGDQFLTAQEVTQRGLGIALDQETVNATTLRETVGRVAREPSWRSATSQMQRIAQEAGGYQRATDAILQFAEIRRNTKQGEIFS
ncbi:glycosyl transferase [Ktedonosporobacter rubrisoli]|uniref:Glycosyl transferase n=1 Tax=Ktedonosporobacter rubrisoli TaxID=2509675 RepID=A0A4V0YZ91_KTERU|nr:macrolide family glycosyltransferase [Ktedonosporobacter rubrisoli]QBD78901.1 glycosyl transferase [Ktedonosporobacter rubrisoli]